MTGRKKHDDESVTSDVKDALRRVLKHAESHGEVYEGATKDHAILREAIGAAIEDDDDSDDTNGTPDIGIVGDDDTNG